MLAGSGYTIALPCDETLDMRRCIRSIDMGRAFQSSKMDHSPPEEFEPMDIPLSGRARGSSCVSSLGGSGVDDFGNSIGVDDFEISIGVEALDDSAGEIGLLLIWAK